nr:hypothetical protein [Desulforamulus aquiferis]
MKTKDFLEKTAISESTLRRWLKNGQPLPELNNVQRDWRGQRSWDQSHVELVLAYKRDRLNYLNKGDKDGFL